MKFELDVTTLGVRRDCDAPQTAALQRAIDDVAALGGGTVRLPAGRYVTGMLRLRDLVELHLAEGATLFGSDEPDHYPIDASMFTDAVGQRRGRCLILADHVRGISITGPGAIDGNGTAFTRPDRYENRPFLVRFVGCRDVVIRDVTLRDSAAWVLHLLDCDTVRVQGVTVHSHVNHNNDGIDIDSCRQVLVSDCDIDTGDDALCLKSTLSSPCEDVLVRDCVLNSSCGAIKIGTESHGDIRRVRVRSCHVRHAGLCGIKVISMDGAHIEDVQISDIQIDEATGPIFVRLGARLRTYRPDQTRRRPGVIRDLRIERVEATVRLPRQGKCNFFTREIQPPEAFSGILVTGIPGHPIERLTLADVRVRFPGGGSIADRARAVPEQIAEYPEQFYFGVLPASAAFIRHVRSAVLENFQFDFDEPDARPPIVLDDAQDVSRPSLLQEAE